MLNTNIKHVGHRKQVITDYKRFGTVEPKQYYAEPVSCNVVKFPKYENIDNRYYDVTKYVAIGGIHPIPEDIKRDIKYQLSNWYFKNISPTYKVEKNKGINCYDSRARKEDLCLALYSQKVAENMDISTLCYTGVKHALWSSGILEDYSDMPKGSAYLATDYFDKYPNKFERLDVKLKDLKKLPAGYIIVYKKDGLDGHIAITNGYGQEMSDCTDNMKWVEKHKEGSSFTVYRLSDGWKYDYLTKKLKFYNS